MKYSIALVLLIESINNINGFILPRLPNILGLNALGARGISGGGGNKNNLLNDWLDGKKEVLRECADNQSPLRAHEKIKQDQDLLSYIRSLPPTEMKQLTNVSQDVLTAMKGFVAKILLL